MFSHIHCCFRFCYHGKLISSPRRNKLHPYYYRYFPHVAIYLLVVKLLLLATLWVLHKSVTKMRLILSLVCKIEEYLTFKIHANFPKRTYNTRFEHVLQTTNQIFVSCGQLRFQQSYETGSDIVLQLLACRTK